MAAQLAEATGFKGFAATLRRGLREIASTRPRDLAPGPREVPGVAIVAVADAAALWLNPSLSASPAASALLAGLICIGTFLFIARDRLPRINRLPERWEFQA